MPLFKKKYAKRRYSKKKKYSKKKISSGQSSIRARRLRDGTGSGAFQISRFVPASLPLVLKYTGSFLATPHQYNAALPLSPRKPCVFYFQASSLNPGCFQHFGFDGFVRNWPFGDDDPNSTTVVAQQHIGAFYRSAIIEKATLKCRIRVTTGQQPLSHIPPHIDDCSYVNDFHVSLQQSDVILDDTSNFTICATSGRKIRMYNQMQGGQDGGVEFSIDYDPRKRLSVVDPTDNADLKFDAQPNPDGEQPEPDERTYFCVAMKPAFSRLGGNLEAANKMPQFSLNYHIEYQVRYIEKLLNPKRDLWPLMLTKNKHSPLRRK